MKILMTGITGLVGGAFTTALLREHPDYEVVSLCRGFCGAAGKKLYYHTWNNENNTRKYEVDFLIPDGSKISVIEVKSSQSKLHSSIDNFIKKYSARIQQSYIIHTKDMRKDGAIKCIPFYMTPFL